MSPTVTILLVLGAGLFVGGQLNSASEAHAYFSSSRTRITRGFTAWVRQVFRATIGVAALVLLVYYLLGRTDWGA